MADWCEPNSVHVVQIAETYNTLSSAWYALATIPIMRLPGPVWREFVVYMWLVALTSAYYHATLYRHAQLLDEISIVLLCAHLLYTFYGRPEWTRARYQLTAGAVGVMLLLPEFNTRFLMLGGIVVVLFLGSQEMRTSVLLRPEFLAACCKFSMAVSFWMMDQLCLVGLHFHFAWHFFSAVSVMWTVLWLARDRYHLTHVDPLYIHV